MHACARAPAPGTRAAVKHARARARAACLHIARPTPKKPTHTQNKGKLTINGTAIPYVELKMNLSSLLAGSVVGAKVAACPDGKVSAFAAVGAAAAPQGSIAVKAFYDIKADTVFPYGADNNVTGETGGGGGVRVLRAPGARRPRPTPKTNAPTRLSRAHTHFPQSAPARSSSTSRRATGRSAPRPTRSPSTCVLFVCLWACARVVCWVRRG